MKILKRILIVLISIVALAAIIGFFMPSKMHVERSVVMKASPEVIYSQVNDLTTLTKWDPWLRLDPNIKITWGETTTGVGASYSWISDVRDVGTGKITIVKSIPSEEVQSELEFAEHAKAVGNFKLEKTDGGTKVTWGFDGDMGANPFMHIMGAMMDKMVGGQFEKGLASLDSLTASIPTPSMEMTITSPVDSAATTATK